MDEACRTKRPVKKIDFGRDDLVRDGFGAGSPVTSQFTETDQNRPYWTKTDLGENTETDLNGPGRSKIHTG